jgi:molybdate transport system ATP-binding protein
MIHIAVRKKLQFAGASGLLDVDIEICEQSFVALTGPSGSGKTTLLRMIAGLTQPDEGMIESRGNIWFDAKTRINIPTRQRSIGFVFQDFALFPRMSVRQNIEYACSDRKFARELLDMVSLSAFAESMPSSLSGGQKQRLALIRSIAARPGILLLDEPLSAVDGDHRIRLQEEMGKIFRNEGMTVIMVSHDIQEIFHLADRAVILESGRVVADDLPSRVWRNTVSSHKLFFTGDLLDIIESDVTAVLVVAYNNRIAEIVVSRDEAKNYRKGDIVDLGCKAFHVSVSPVKKRKGEYEQN